MKPPRDDINWWPLYILLLAVCAVVAWAGFSAGGNAVAAVMLVVPVFAWVMSRLIIGFFGQLHASSHAARWEEFQGRHYAYGPHTLRTLEFEDALWFYEADILAAANIVSDTLTKLFPLSERKPLDGTKLFVLNEVGIEHLLMKHPDPEAKRLLMYLRREAYYPWKRAHGQKVDAPVPR